MTDTPPRLVNPESSLVVVYQGIDAYFHRRDSEYQNRPACQPDRSPGVLTALTRAQQSGLMPCHQCSEMGNESL